MQTQQRKPNKEEEDHTLKHTTLRLQTLISIF